jgi:AMMECR1 domain-containing protein
MTPAAALTPADRAALLALARAALLHRLDLGPAPAPPAAGPLAAPRGAFLAVSAGGEVRASLGLLAPAGPLGATVARLAARAVDGDPRFPPLAAADAAALSLRLAVVGPLRPLPPGAPLRPGAEGLAVTAGWHRGVLLPSAAAGAGWDAAQFLKHACLAAGLPARAHLEPETAVEVFEAEEFGE